MEKKKPTPRKAAKKPAAKKPAQNIEGVSDVVEVQKRKVTAAKKATFEQVEPSVVITNIYSDNIIEGINQCDKMVESFKAQGYEVANISEKQKHRGNGHIIKELYNCYKRASTGHTYFAYSDGGDTFCQRKFKVPKDVLLYSAERNCYPLVKFADEHPESTTPYRYLNGGGYAGPLSLSIEFFEKYLLPLIKTPEANGQNEQMQAFLKAKADGFPIELDTQCEIFQTTAFMPEGEMDLSGKLIKSNLTGNTPAIFHANGRSPMKWIYNH